MNAKSFRSATCISCFLLLGCGTPQAHYSAVQMRERVMDYYNDQIMENLIRKKNGLPFVHVDLASFNAGAATKLAAAVNGGQSLADTGQTQTTHLGSVTTTVVGTVA